MDTVLPMFEAGEPSGVIRLATLANTTLGGDIFWDFPKALFGGPEQMAAWLGTAPFVELSALFENPNLNDSFLQDLLEGSKPCDSVPNEKLATIVAILAGNERMRAAYDDSYMDGYAEHSHGAVFDAVCKLAGRVPATERWAAALCWFYDRMRPDSFSIAQPATLRANKSSTTAKYSPPLHVRMEVMSATQA